MKVAVLSLTLLTSCEGWEIFPPDEALDQGEAFQISVLSSESCPLPEGLDPKVVTIQSYQVRLRGGDPGGVPVNYFYASLLTADGSRYLAGFAGCKPLLSGPPLQPGETRDGYLNFPLPPTKTPDKLVFAPKLVSGSKDVFKEVNLNAKTRLNQEGSEEN